MSICQTFQFCPLFLLILSNFIHNVHCPILPIVSNYVNLKFFRLFCPILSILFHLSSFSCCPSLFFLSIFFSYFVQYIFPSCFSFSELFTCNIQRLRQDSQRCFISACNPLHSSLLWPLLLRGQDHFQGSGWVHGYRTIHATSQYQQIARMGQVVLWVSRR